MKAENYKNRNKALLVLNYAKEVEENKKNLGFRWMVSGYSRVFANPTKFNSLRILGYKFNHSNK